MTEKDEKVYNLFRSLTTAIYNLNNDTLVNKDISDLNRQLDDLHRAITRHNI